MTATDFTAHLEAGETPVVALGGNVDRNAAGGLRRVFDDAAGTGADRVVFDFTNVSFINSTGIAIIVGILTRAGSSGISTAAFGLTPHFQEIFEITRIVEFMPVYEDRPTALDPA